MRPVHRLDRDTSGCILFGKTKEAQQYYTDELQAGRIDRIYTGLVEGRIDSDGVVDAPIGVDPVFDNRRVIDEFDQPAQTEYTVLGHEGEHTLLKFKLLTGRTHQTACTWNTSDILSLATPCMGHVINPIHVNAYMRQNSPLYPYGKDEPITVNCEVGMTLDMKSNNCFSNFYQL